MELLNIRQRLQIFMLLMIFNLRAFLGLVFVIHGKSTTDE